MFYSGSWKEKDVFKLVVKYNWKNGYGLAAPSSDYTVSAYSLQNLKIVNSDDPDVAVTN